MTFANVADEVARLREEILESRRFWTAEARGSTFAAFGIISTAGMRLAGRMWYRETAPILKKIETLTSAIVSFDPRDNVILLHTAKGTFEFRNGEFIPIGVER